MFRHGEFLVIPRAMYEKSFGALGIALASDANAPTTKQADRSENGAIVLGMGETGHAHVILDPERLIDARVIGDVVYMDIKHPSMLVHDGYEGPREHSDIEIPVGEWVAIRQREYVDTMTARTVID